MLFSEDSMSLSTTRPSTSKPRGVCRYYSHPRGCFAADKCKFLHGEPPIEAKPDDLPMLSPYDKAKRCDFYAQGFCKRGDACWFLHVSDRKIGDSCRLSEDEDEELCSICFEKPPTFGLLGGCSHIFCITCIKQWRDPKNKPGGVVESGNTKKCPMCRASTNFITPSSKFWKEGTKEKDETIKAYKESMSRVSCRWFQKSLLRNQDKPFCPYGKDCFYQHINADGTPHMFKDGVDVTMRQSRRHGGPVLNDFNIMSFSLDFADFLLPVDRQTRFTIREQPIAAAQSNVSETHPTQPLHRRRDLDRRRVNAARRLQQVGESLERLNDVISEGATLDSLNTAVEALRAGLGNLDDGRRPDRVTRIDEADDGTTADRQEDEVMERLEVLADQMLASIQVLRMNTQEEDTGRDGAETPLPALEPLEGNSGPSGDITFDMPSPQFPPNRWRASVMPSPQFRPNDWRASVDDGYESVDSSMPGLQSVSSSGDEGTNEDETLSRRAMRLGDSTATHAVERIQSIEPFSGSLRRRVDEEEGENGNLNSMTDTSTTETSTEESRSEPPFVTDGRGRVVWTSPAEDDKTSRPTEEQTGEPASRPEVASGSGGLLGWFNALF